MRAFFDFVRSIMFWSVFFFAALFIALSYPAIKFFAPKNEKIFQNMMKFFLRIAFRISFIDISMIGAENIPKNKGFVIAANHSSFIDSLALIAWLPISFKIVAARAGFKLPLMGRVFAGAGYIPTGLSMNFDEQAGLYKALKNKDNVLIYSKLPKESEIGRFTEAMVAAAKEAGVPILPICIKGSTKVMPMKKFILREGKISIRIGEPIFLLDLKSVQGEMERLYQMQVF